MIRNVFIVVVNEPAGLAKFYSPEDKNKRCKYRFIQKRGPAFVRASVLFVSVIL